MRENAFGIMSMWYNLRDTQGNATFKSFKALKCFSSKGKNQLVNDSAQEEWPMQKKRFRHEALSSRSVIGYSLITTEPVVLVLEKKSHQKEKKWLCITNI